MATIAVERPSQTWRGGAAYGARRAALVAAGLAVFWGLWEAYRFVGERAGIT